MRSSIKRLFSGWNFDNIKVVRRVIVSVVGASVLLIGIALLVLPGLAFVVIPVGLAILATEYAWARRWLRKARRIASDGVSGRKRTSVPDLVSPSHRGEHEKRASECAEDQAHEPERAFLRERGDCSDRNCDLEHSHRPGEHFVLVKV
jgi:putative transmembrane protein PGPGW